MEVSTLTQVLGESAFNIIRALLVLLVGWLVAWILARLTRGLFRRIKLDDRTAAWMAALGAMAR